MEEIDARGLACPAPVLQTKAFLDEMRPDGVRVVIDNKASQENVQRFLESQGFETVLEQAGADFYVVGNCDVNSSEELQPLPEVSGDARKIMVMCATDRLGKGDDILGQKLMVNFLRTLKEMGEDLWCVVFVNSGVKLTLEGSEVLDDLKGYEAAGSKILVCGTCLDHFKVLEKKQVGETTNMLDIISAMQIAEKIINL